MKNHLLILLLFNFSFSIAQTEYGIISSLTKTSINNKHIYYIGGLEKGHKINFKGYNNFAYGGFIKFSVNNSFKLKSELLYANNDFSAKEHIWDESYLLGGDEIKNDSYVENIAHQFNMNSLNVNLLLIHKLIFVTFDFGVNYNIPIKAVDNITSATKEFIFRNEGEFNIEGTKYNMEKINQNRVNLILGLSKKINSTFDLFLRYTKGIKPFRENYEDIDKFDVYSFGINITTRKEK